MKLCIPDNVLANGGAGGNVYVSVNLENLFGAGLDLLLVDNDGDVGLYFNSFDLTPMKHRRTVLVDNGGMSSLEKQKEVESQSSKKETETTETQETIEEEGKGTKKRKKA
ncbi:hypothetical protein L484_012920 [Morus notabilis]|uniref:Uncharacterized protein n=1 Tax=Morus notabilis TaxID=981085 RepID=W9QRK4_9ROSA|nr:hypothetical protein L484_012920 [Morus notabilis]